MEGNCWRAKNFVLSLSDTNGEDLCVRKWVKSAALLVAPPRTVPLSLRTTFGGEIKILYP